jgi:hypothetical protein
LVQDKGQVAGFCEHGNEYFCCSKWGGGGGVLTISGILAPQKQLSTMEFVIICVMPWFAALYAE